MKKKKIILTLIIFSLTLPSFCKETSLKDKNPEIKSGSESGITYKGETNRDARILKRFCRAIAGNVKGITDVSLEKTNIKINVTEGFYKKIQKQERAESRAFFSSLMKQLQPDMEIQSIVIQVFYGKKMVIMAFIDKYTLRTEVMFVD